MGITTRHKEFDEGVPSGFMTPEQVATYLGCGRTYAYGLLATARIRSLKLGKLRHVRPQDLDRYLDERAEDPHPSR